MKKYSLWTKKYLNMLDFIIIPFNYSLYLTILLTTFSFLNGLIPIINLIAISTFIDKVKNYYLLNDNTNGIIFSLILIFSCFLYTTFVPLLMEYINIKIKNNLKESFGIEIIERIGCLKYKYFENDKIKDIISRVSDDTENYFINIYENMLGFLSLIIKILGIMIVIFKSVPWATIMIALLAIPTLFVAYKSGQINYQANIDSEKYNRRVDYLSKILIERSFSKERNLFNYSKKVNEEWYSHYNNARQIKFEASVKWLKGSEISGILTSTLIGIIILILLIPLKNKTLTLGIFIAVVNSIIVLIPDLAWQLPEYTQAFSHANEYLKDFSSFMNLELNKNYTCLPYINNEVVDTIEFIDVCFKYPKTERYVIKNLNFKMESGKHYSFVGKNGCGKSTIIKILTGLYDEFDGTILINGKNIKSYKPNELKSLFSVIYQDFLQYPLSFKDNIEIGNINFFNTEFNFHKLKQVINCINLKEVYEKLPYGINTDLGKVKKNSYDLSKGQWQKITIARALMNNASFRIMDEPTSFLDSISEEQLYNTLKIANKGKTTLFVSHRLSSTVFVDKIFVIEDGRIIEEGNFDELMKKNGVYAKMFNTQRQWYKNEKEI